MENVLASHERPCDAERPVICMDEKPVQLVRETRERLPATQQFPERVDYEYGRAGTAALFLFSERLAAWRAATDRERRAQLDWAEEVAALLEGRYADCERVTLGLDNLNTHPPGALCEAFEPQRARALAERIEFCCTPKRASWLNGAEVELSALTRRCLGHLRIGDLAPLRREIAAWATNVNQRQPGADWHLTIDDTRSKLKSGYPKMLT